MSIAPLQTQNLVLVPESRATTEARIAQVPADQKVHLSPTWLALLSKSGPIDPRIHGSCMHDRINDDPSASAASTARPIPRAPSK